MTDSTGERRQILYTRPSEVLLNLPLKYRWEFTRRHPYYLTHWERARDYRRNVASPTQEPANVGFLSYLLLGQIGVTGEPVDPATPFEDLDGHGDVDPGFLPGAAQPMTYRNIASNIIAALPATELKFLSAVLEIASAEQYAVPNDNSDLSFQRRKALLELAQTPSSNLDSYLIAPLYYLHLNAAQNSIVDSVAHQVRQWKERRGIPDTRLHTTKLDDCLRAWDLREGWADAHYDKTLAKSLEHVRKMLAKPKPTAIRNYQSAFKWIIGCDYSIAAWAVTMAPAVCASNVADLARAHVRRFQRLVSSRTPPTAAESTLSSRPSESTHSSGFFDTLSSSHGDADFVDQCSDTQTLIEHGLGDDEICAELEVGRDLVAYVRQRVNDER